ncbi:MAG: Gfo/Idh/MocA family oxidoreductase [Planctomycetaceae bacterium]|nr:Gfo/Idh/MocA family oxidoreductase [Planctomycetaceae bacterium]
MTQQSLRINRRSFIAAGAAAVASPLVLSSNILGRDGVIPPNERIVLGLIGYGNRGSEISGDFIGNRGDFHMVAMCDCVKANLDRGVARVNRDYGNSDCSAYEKYEDLLARTDIDAVAVSTPDHWHTKISVEACKAGKDVYCEKPLTHTPAESRQIVAAARKYNRVCTSGSQRVMEDYGYMAPIVQSGALGEVKEAFFEVGGPPDDAYWPEETVPAGFNWDRWLGPAPWVPFHPERCSGSYGGGWRRYSDYGNGFLADWGAHKLAGLLYVLGIDDQEPLEILPPGCEGNSNTDRLTLVYPGGIKLHHVRGGHDITLVGSERTFRHGGDRNLIRPIGHVDVRRYNGNTSNLSRDFAHCVRHRLRPFQDFLYGAIAATGCQLAHYAYKLNRPLKWDAERTAFIGDEQANRLVSKPKRSPYEINDI